MLAKVKEIVESINNFKIDGEEQLEVFRQTYIAKKGLVNELFEKFKDAAPEDRKQFGIELNKLKNLAQDKFKTSAKKLKQSSKSQKKNEIDLTLPPIPHELGTRHPLSITLNRIIQIFERIGFNLSKGPEIEEDWYNFSALNFDEDHPAREMQDTFFIEKDPDMVLRTHTSSVQVRVMEDEKPPIRTLSPGRVFRNEAISARAHCVFHQVEGLYVDEDVSFANLKETVHHFVKEMFGSETKMRFRPSYFPFTEPSAEIDISCLICGGEGCKVCKNTGWVEIGGAGMVDPNVLENCKIDPNKYTGFAFGMGVERIAMLKYQIDDLRLFTENDVRFLRQFKGVI